MAEPPVGLRRVLVTGATGGIGRELVASLVARGARVCASGRRADALATLANDFGATTLAVDLRDRDAAVDLVTRAEAALGGLDGVVCNAGAIRHELVADLGAESLRDQMAVNFEAPLWIAQRALEHLAPGGALVFVTSTLAERPIPTSLAYSAAKAALTAAARVIAQDAAPKNIRANIVSPGVIDTEMIRAPRPGVTDQARHLEGLRALHPLGRLGEPADVVAAILYLLEAPWITGTVLTVDGGSMVRS